VAHQHFCPINKFFHPVNQPTLPFTYARVITDNVLVYETTALTPVRSLGAGYLWVSLTHSQPISQHNQIWYVINEHEYARGDQSSIFTPSTFRGVRLTGTPERPFARMIFDMWISATPGVPALKGAPLLKRYTLVPIFEEQWVGARVWYRVGPDQWLEQGNLGLVKPSFPPEGIGPNDQWILNLLLATVLHHLSMDNPI